MADHTIENRYQGDNGLTIDLITLKPGGIIPAHYHQKKNEAYAWQAGRGIVKLNGVEYPFEAGPLEKTLVQIPAGTTHMVVNPENKPLVFLAIYWASPETKNDYYPE